MKFGLRNTSFVYPQGSGDIWRDLKDCIQRAERDGFDTFWLMDHFYQLPSHGSPHEPFLDAWTALPALAAVTGRIRLGPMVSPVGYRNPTLLARMAASLDRISAGRLYFGFGAGGYRPEYESYGFNFNPSGARRLAEMREALEIITGLWAQTPFSYEGRFFSVRKAILEPKPLQQPRPPILIGGVGPKITLRIIAEMGDACNLWGPPQAFVQQRETLKQHCLAVGRDEGEIEKTTYDLAVLAPTEDALQRKIARLLPEGVEPWMALVGTPEKIVDLVGEYGRVGAQQLCIEFRGNDPESYALFIEEVMPHFQ